MAGKKPLEKNMSARKCYCNTGRQHTTAITPLRCLPFGAKFIRQQGRYVPRQPQILDSPPKRRQNAITVQRYGIIPTFLETTILASGPSQSAAHILSGLRHKVTHVDEVDKKQRGASYHVTGKPSHIWKIVCGSTKSFAFLKVTSPNIMGSATVVYKIAMAHVRSSSNIHIWL